MMTLGKHCWCLSILLIYRMYPGYTMLWWPRVYIACAYLNHYYTLCTLDTHCRDDPGYTLLVLIYINLAHVPWMHIVIMTLGIHCCCSSLLLYLKYSGYTLLWWPCVYVAGAYLYYYYTLCTLDTHCYDDLGYTWMVLIYIIIIPYVLWIHIVMITLGIHCWCLSLSLFYLMYPGYTLLWWPLVYHEYKLLWWTWVYIAAAYLYHYTLCILHTHCYDDPGYTLLVLNFITIIPFVPWIHIVMMTKGIHCWFLSISLLYHMYPRYKLLGWSWVYIAGAFLYHYYTLCTLDTYCYDIQGYTLLVLIYITIITYVPWIHIVLMTLGIHCWRLSI